MNTQKITAILLFVLFAIPIPLSLFSWIGTLISVANIGTMNWGKTDEMIQGIVALTTMVIAGTYLITYIISLIITLKTKKISFLSFLPVLHVILFGVFCVIWKWLNMIYKV